MRHPVREIDDARTDANGGADTSEAPTRRFGGAPVGHACEREPLGAEMYVETQRPLGLT